MWPLNQFLNTHQLCQQLLSRDAPSHHMETSCPSECHRLRWQSLILAAGFLSLNVQPMPLLPVRPHMQEPGIFRNFPSQTSWKNILDRNQIHLAVSPGLITVRLSCLISLLSQLFTAFFSHQPSHGELWKSYYAQVGTLLHSQYEYLGPHGSRRKHHILLAAAFMWGQRDVPDSRADFESWLIAPRTSVEQSNNKFHFHNSSFAVCHWSSLKIYLKDQQCMPADLEDNAFSTLCGCAHTSISEGLGEQHQHPTT